MWFLSASFQSSQAYEFMKKDLEEIKNTLQDESVTYISTTASAVTSTASYIKDTVVDTVTQLALEEEEFEAAQKAEQEKISTSGKDKDSDRPADFPESLTIKATEKLTSVFNSLVDALSPKGFDDSDDEVILGDGNDTVSITRERWNILLSAVQTDPETYCHEPEGAPEDHEAWLERFSLIDHEHRVRNLLDTVQEINKYYEKLVPKELTHDMFWNRYFYRVEQLKDLEVKRAISIRNHGTKDASPEARPLMTQPQTERVDLRVLAEIESQPEIVPQTPSPVSSEASVVSSKSRKSPGSSEDWEKADLTDIVDEAAKRLGDKLNAMAPPENTRSDEEWEFE